MIAPCLLLHLVGRYHQLLKIGSSIHLAFFWCFLGLWMPVFPWAMDARVSLGYGCPCFLGLWMPHVSFGLWMPHVSLKQTCLCFVVLLGWYA